MSTSADAFHVETQTNYPHPRGVIPVVVMKMDIRPVSVKLI